MTFIMPEKTNHLLFILNEYFIEIIKYIKFNLNKKISENKCIKDNS